MKPRTTYKKQPFQYRLFSTAGRWLYTLRMRLERFNDYLDKLAGEYWEEE